jgi:hypothetical protein
MKASPLHVVLTGNYHSAFKDWWPRIQSLSVSRNEGIDDQGRTIKFVSAWKPRELRGLRIDSWEVHPTARKERDFDECVMILKSRCPEGGAA